MSEIKIIFTLCSNNYLAQALVLAKSAYQYQPDWQFVIGLVDKKMVDIDYNNFGCWVLEVENVEPGIRSLAEKYSIVELNTCVKPAFFNYFINVFKAEQVVYLDPDICLYQPMTEIDQRLANADILLTPHVLTPIPIDHCSPQESLFLNYGIYNLGFLALKKTEQTVRFLQWWKERTYMYGYDNPAIGLFTDQLWINLVPVYFDKVEIIRHAGYNMAPWNLHERNLQEKDRNYVVNANAALVFFHFSGYDPNKEKLHKDYTRFEMNERADLIKLFQEYKRRLEQEDMEKYKTYSCYYVDIRNQFLQSEESLKKKQEEKKYANLPYHKKFFRQVKRHLPDAFKNSVLKLIRI